MSEVLENFGAGFLDEETCRRWILGRLYPSGSSCPGCGKKLEGKCEQRFWEGTRVGCQACGKFFTALTGTFLSGCHLNYSGMFLLAVFLSLGIRSDLIADKLEISVETVRLWKQRYEAIDKMRKLKAAGAMQEGSPARPDDLVGETIVKTAPTGEGVD